MDNVYSLPAGGSAGGAVAGVVGSAMNLAGGYVAQKMHNDNQANLLAMQNRYNEPINQRKRLEMAGFNPYFAAGGINPGNQATAGDPSAGTAAMSNGVLGASNMIGNVALQMAQIRAINAQAQGEEINNVTKGAINQLNADMLEQQLKDWKFKVDNLNPAQLWKLNSETDELISRNIVNIRKASNLDEATNLIMKQIKGVDLDNQQKEIVNSQLKERLELEMKNLEMQNVTGFMNAVSNRMSARGALMAARANSALAASQGALFDSQTDLNKQQHSFKSNTWYDDITIRANEAKSSHHRSNMDEFDDKSKNSTWWNRIIQGYIPFVNGMPGRR